MFPLFQIAACHDTLPMKLGETENFYKTAFKLELCKRGLSPLKTVCPTVTQLPVDMATPGNLGPASHRYWSLLPWAAICSIFYSQSVHPLQSMYFLYMGTQVPAVEHSIERHLFARFPPLPKVQGHGNLCRKSSVNNRLMVQKHVKYTHIWLTYNVLNWMQVHT